ncbi:hypothetical protein [Paenibacillus senegalimassiliensis]|uniref:hypothetical protein n=1 Tax=Paenibacillus senegalimassiliensis TaxID=1737426 RepID=UPI000A6193F8|nr:hypothetical protein [Paenibacillus senegalimassiliensis]
MDQVHLGKMTADETNVEMVRMKRVRVAVKIPADVRKALNTAVRSGQLAHKKRDGHKPEVYYHPDFEYLANDERNQAEPRAIKALAGVLARPD